MVEGKFPKEDGDIAYASEFNLLANGNLLSGLTPTLTDGWSTENFHLGSMTNYDFINVAGSGAARSDGAQASGGFIFDLGGNRAVRGIGLYHRYWKKSTGNSFGATVYVSGPFTTGFIVVPNTGKVGDADVYYGISHTNVISGTFQGVALLSPQYSFIRYINFWYQDGGAAGSVMVEPIEFQA